MKTSYGVRMTDIPTNSKQLTFAKQTRNNDVVSNNSAELIQIRDNSTSFVASTARPAT